MYHVYLIEAQNSGKRYIGYTSDLRQRLANHNRHKNISTAQGSGWKLIYCETYLNKMDALGREKFLKSGSGWRFLKKQIRHYLEKMSDQTPSVIHDPHMRLGVDIVIHNTKREILLVRREDDHCWCMPGGWVEANETPDNAIKRELKEETGLHCVSLRLADICVRNSGTVHLTYVAMDCSGKIRGSVEGKEVKFMDPANVKKWHADHQERMQRSMDL